MTKTTISWTGETWPIVVGCEQISPGCKHCYAMRTVDRVNRCQRGLGRPAPYANLVELVQLGGRKVPRWTGEVAFNADRLTEPFAWREPRKVFVASQSDVFHDKVTEAQRDRILAVMLLSPRHTFQVLTKRPAAMRRYLTDLRLYDRVLAAADELRRDRPALLQVGISNPVTTPAPWIWWGVSAEDQESLDDRVPELRGTPAAVRFLSGEPLLGPLDLRPHLYALDWVIAGCESGRGARFCLSEWVRAMRDQCLDAGVALFVKQLKRGVGVAAGAGSRRHRGVIELPYLDGVQHAAFPAVAT